MQRRDFLAAAAAGSAATVVGTATAGASQSSEERIPPLMFDSAGSLVAPGRPKEPLRDPAEHVVALWAGERAKTHDADGKDEAVHYDGLDVPMVGLDGHVVGFAGMIADGPRNWQYGNEEFLLNVWDGYVRGDTVLFDEGHEQFYDTEKFQAFIEYAEANGYTVESTTNLLEDLPDADAVMITSPSVAYDDEELAALREFEDDANAVFLHHQSDYSDYDETKHLDEVADALDLAFRFNDAQVLDDHSNAGEPFKPVTDRFTGVGERFTDPRDGLGLDPDERYRATVTKVTDGDTVEVEIPEHGTESIRVLGVDTPETPENSKYEREEEWEGIDSLDTLGQWGTKATAFGKSRLAGQQVEIAFDENEPVRDPFGRLLAYVYYQPSDGGNDDGDGKFSRLYNADLVRTGFARVYGSSFARHDQFLVYESQARQAGAGLWAQSTPGESSQFRNDEFDTLFFPNAASVKDSWGELDSSRAPVFAHESATQAFDDGDGGGLVFDWTDDDVGYDRPPLVGVDDEARVAVVGAPIIAERYEKEEDYAVDTAPYGNYSFMTNLVEYVSGTGSGSVLIDGGHGQFNVDYALSSEDVAYYQRHLEGVGIGLSQANDLTNFPVQNYRAVIVTAPPEPFTREEKALLRQYAQAGGGVVLVGSAMAPEEAQSNLNDLAEALDTDLRLNADAVSDSKRPVADDPAVFETSAFNDDFPLFRPFGQSKAERCGATQNRVVEQGTLDGNNDFDSFFYETVTDDPCRMEIAVEGPNETDFDVYVTFDARIPTVHDHDAAAESIGSDELLRLEEKHAVTGRNRIKVRSHSGSGPYTMVITEYGRG
jgi:endonuclease YncB( thermonuclease family)